MSRTWPKVPPVVQVLCRDYGAWIVGSGVLWMLNHSVMEAPADLDVIVPPWQYAKAAHLIPKGSTTNKFGGVRIYVDEEPGQLDVWPMELGEYFRTLPTGYAQKALNPVYRLVITSETT